MVSRYAIVEADVVSNVVLASQEVAEANGWIQAPDYVGPGWGYTISAGFYELPPIPPTREQQSSLRSTAYRAESDPVFFKAQRGEATMDEWLAIVEDIKARYPYPTV